MPIEAADKTTERATKEISDSVGRGLSRRARAHRQSEIPEIVLDVRRMERMYSMLIDRFGLPSFLGNNIPMDSHDAAGPNHRPIGNLRVARSTYAPAYPGRSGSRA
jgi:hypothetical protein